MERERAPTCLDLTPLSPLPFHTHTQPPTDPALRRTSSRVKGIQSDGMYIVEERARGGAGSRITVAAPNADAARAGTRVEVVLEEAGPTERHPAGDVPFKSENGLPGMDEAFLAVLQRAAAGGGAGAKEEAAPGALLLRSAGPPPLTTAAPPSLAAATLAEEDVTKVTREGIVHLAFHPAAVREGAGSGGGPASHRLLLAAGAKSGRVSLWDVDWTPPAGGGGGGDGGGEDEEGTDADAGVAAADDAGAAAGVLEFAPHFAYISGLAWAPQGGAGGTLFTASYDGSVRALDVSSGGGAFAPALLHADAEFSAFDVAPDGSWGVVADKDGVARVFDPRSGGVPASSGEASPSSACPTAGSRGAVVGEHALAEKKVNCLSVEPGAARAIAASFSDGAVRVFDLRALGTGGLASSKRGPPTACPLATAAHAQTVQGCYFAPDGSGRILTTSRDDTLGVWGGVERAGSGGKKGGPTDLTRLATAKHNNNTGRWVIPFRAVWAPPAWAGDTVLVGGMARTIDVFSAGSGKALASLRSPDCMTAIPSRVAAHPSVPVLAGATASGRVNVFRGPGA